MEILLYYKLLLGTIAPEGTGEPGMYLFKQKKKAASTA